MLLFCIVLLDEVRQFCSPFDIRLSFLQYEKKSVIVLKEAFPHSMHMSTQVSDAAYYISNVRKTQRLDL
jgi:hypothetical protein